MSVLGVAELAWAANALASLVGAATLGLYLLVYTPLKRRSPWNTHVGGVAGALPPLLGWVAARGEIGAGGWTLFAMQFLWQVPHFLAIAWLYRDDYRRAGFKMLPVVEPAGDSTARHSVAHAGALGAVSVVPFALGLAGVGYLGGAVILGSGFLACAIRFARGRRPADARRLFLASVIYLPSILGLWVWDRAR
jgi:protoheme IX farnesyltransferase